MFFGFVGLAFSAIFGIDFGSESIKASMALSGKSIHVALNAQSKRLSPSYFSFFNTSSPKNTVPGEDGHWHKDELRNYTWLFFDAARSNYFRFPNNTIKGMSPMLERVHGFDRRESLAITLRHLISSIDDGRWKPEAAKIVFAVEPLMTHEERFAVFEAIQIMNASLTHIIDYPTAAAELYALEKHSSYLRKDKTVVFIDIGATNSWASVFLFQNTHRQPTITELSLVTKANLGGNLIDKYICDLALKKYAETYSIPVPTDPKIVLRFMEESRKVKELLTLNKEADIHLEDVEPDRSFNFKLTLEEFQSLLKDFGETLSEIYQEVIAKAGLESKDIDSIELIGGSTRIPYLQDVLIKESGLSKLNRTMNSDEAVALGAGYVGASESTLFIIKKITMKAFCNMNVFLLHGNNEEIQIFNETSYLTDTYKYTFDAKDNDNITIMAGNPPTKVITMFMNLSNNTKPSSKIVLNIGFNEFTIPNITSIKLNGFNYNMSKAIFYHNDWEYDYDHLNQSFEFVHEFDNIDKERKEFQEAFDSYESYIFTIKDKVRYVPEFQRVLNETEGEYLISVAEEHRKWLDENAGKLTLDMIKEHHDKLKDVLKEPERREDHFNKINDTIRDFEKSLERMYKEITETWPKKKKWMPKEKIEQSWESYNNSLDYLNEEKAFAIGKRMYEAPHAWWNQINVQRQIMEFNFNKTCEMKKPTPTPKPTPIDPNSTNVTDSNEVKADKKEEEEHEESPEEKQKKEEKKRMKEIELKNHREEFLDHLEEFRIFFDKCNENIDDYPEDVKKEYKRLCEDYRDMHFKYMDQHEKYVRDAKDDHRPPPPPRRPRRPRRHPRSPEEIRRREEERIRREEEERERMEEERRRNEEERLRIEEERRRFDEEKRRIEDEHGIPHDDENDDFIPPPPPADADRHLPPPPPPPVRPPHHPPPPPHHHFDDDDDFYYEEEEDDFLQVVEHPPTKPPPPPTLPSKTDKIVKEESEETKVEETSTEKEEKKEETSEEEKKPEKEEESSVVKEEERTGSGDEL
ncbi:dnaK protein [Histomonas meleagridis]|uniref:dnaK protein n=1 Tax=Histomonas meleagridis TaxID=135588 RepID=UPI00355A41E3|nr:dnaK protein [Histomonas meleagridis]KAH0805328.1 dnaK protein [Histomonas meleagridis]